MDRDNGILLLLGGAAFAMYMATAGSKTPNRLQNPGEEAARQTYMRQNRVNLLAIRVKNLTIDDLMHCLSDYDVETQRQNDFS